MIYNERDVEKLDAKEKNAQKIWVKCLNEKILKGLKEIQKPSVLYIDLAGNWNKQESSVELLYQLLKSYSQSLEVLWLNLSSWKDMSDNQVSYLMFSIMQNQKLKILTIDLAGWKYTENKLITEEAALYIGNGLERLKGLQHLSLWLAGWQQMSDSALGYIYNSVSQLKQLQYLDLSL